MNTVNRVNLRESWETNYEINCLRFADKLALGISKEIFQKYEKTYSSTTTISLDITNRH